MVRRDAVLTDAQVDADIVDLIARRRRREAAVTAMGYFHPDDALRVVGRHAGGAPIRVDTPAAERNRRNMRAYRERQRAAKEIA